MADTFDRAESAPGIKPIQSTSGRIYKTFGPPSQEHAALEAAKKHMDKTRKPISVQHRLGLIHFQRFKDQDYFEEVIHPEAVHYPSIHRSKKTVEEVIAALKVNVETGLDSETAAELLKEDMELDKGDILAGLVAVGDSAEKAGLELALERDVERVIRDGREQTLHALDLVRGDVLRLQTGDVVPTDVIIVSIISRPCIVTRRNVPDYGDFISPNGLPDAQELRKAKAEKGELLRSSSLARTVSGTKQKMPTGDGTSLNLMRTSSKRDGDDHHRSLARLPSELRDHHAALHNKTQNASTKKGFLMAGSKKDLGGVQPDGSFRPPQKKYDMPVKFSATKGIKRREDPKPRDRWSVEGWDSGVRACMPVCTIGSICHHGDVVQWGECIAVCTQPPKQSSWSGMWRKVLRVRAIRAKELSDEADEANGAKDEQYEFKTMKRLKTLAKMGLNITHAATAKVLGDVTCVVLEDDFRFRPSFRSSDNDAGIGIGVAADEEEFRYRYKDLLGLATRTGIAVCIMLRRNTVSEVDVARISRWLRLPVVSAANGHFDHCSRPLSDMFAAGGGIVLVGSELGAAAALVNAVQRCDAKSALATYKKHTVDAIRNPHGVLSHMLKNGVAELDKNIVENMGPVNASKEEKKAEAERAKTLMNSLIQDDEDDPRYQLVAFVGEDWAALSAADVAVTWNSSLSPGAYEAQKLACVTLAENSPSRMLQAMSEYEMKVHSGGSGSSCTVA